MNQVSFGNGVPTRTQVAVHSVGAQSTDGESSEAVAASDTMTQSGLSFGICLYVAVCNGYFGG